MTWGIRLEPLVISLVLLVVALVVVALFRRHHISPGHRYVVPLNGILVSRQKKENQREKPLVSTILVYLGILGFLLLVIFIVVYIVPVQESGEKFTEFFILGENRTAEAYPRNITPGKPYPMYIGVGNHEHRMVNYTVEVYLVQTGINETTTSVQSSPRLTLYKTNSLTLGHNETLIVPYEIVFPDTKYNRVDFLLFDENMPNRNVSGLSRERASYRNLHLWITAASPDTTTPIR
jgi:uncharacterized membrane protein